MFTNAENSRLMDAGEGLVLHTNNLNNPHVHCDQTIQSIQSGDIVHGPFVEHQLSCDPWLKNDKKCGAG